MWILVVLVMLVSAGWGAGGPDRGQRLGQWVQPFLRTTFLDVAGHDVGSLTAPPEPLAPAHRIENAPGGLSKIHQPRPAAAHGPLKVSRSNRRYFTDQSGKAVYLTGSHTWTNLQDAGTLGGPLDDVLDYEAHLDWLRARNHNFIRLWSFQGWEAGTHWTVPTRYYEPLPYVRVGPDLALDHQPKFDLRRFNQAYFDRLRSRVIAARDRGLYVSVMLFQGWSVESRAAWRGHPFNRNNNVNGVDGDPDHNGVGEEIYTLSYPDITALQEAYVRKVVDSVNDLDGVLYEVGNEIGRHSTNWQYHVVDYVKDYEATKPKQHPVGMTVQAPTPGTKSDSTSDSTLFQSPAEWVSPVKAPAPYDWVTNPPPADGRKVILADTDHFDPRHARTPAWVWKTFLRGLNPILMDDPKNSDPSREATRIALGQTLALADRMDLNSMVPRNDLASSRYCLANEGVEYLVYLPLEPYRIPSVKGLGRLTPLLTRLSLWFRSLFSRTVTVDLTAASGHLTVEWFNPATGTALAGGTTSGGASRSFRAPFRGHAILHILPRPAT